MTLSGAGFIQQEGMQIYTDESVILLRVKIMFSNGR